MLVRLGLVAFVVTMFINMVYMRFPMTLQASAWYSGVGYAALTRDGVPVYEADCSAIEEAWSVRDAERLAAAEPDRDWRIHLVALRDERHYRRGGDGRWRLYKRGYGLS